MAKKRNYETNKSASTEQDNINDINFGVEFKEEKKGPKGGN